MANGDGNKDQVSVREVTALSGRVDNVEDNFKKMEITLTGIQTDVKEGVKSIHDKMGGLVSQDQLTKVDGNVEKCHTRISTLRWKIIVAVGTITAAVTGWIIDHLTRASP